MISKKLTVSFLLLLCAGIMHGNDALYRRMLSHVEKILVVDSLTVDRDEFFRHYRLPASAGRVLDGREVTALLGKTRLPADFTGTPATGFTNEFNDYMIWAHEDTTGYFRLAESVRLFDGSWSTPQFASSVLNCFEEADDDDDEMAAICDNAAFPFMSDDGQTLYYASDGENSLGGYDIFVATKDPSDGSYLLPQNLGMPFNSPYDDYMLVIDNETGVGWWATDRNRLDGQLTIYVYALADGRENVDPDDENLLSYATLSGWEDLLDDAAQAERKRIKAELSQINVRKAKAEEFTLPMPDGTVYHYFSDFKSPRAATLMQRYVQEEAAFEAKDKELSNLRQQYYLSAGNRQTGAKIQKLEDELRVQRSNLNLLLSEIYRVELP